MGELKEIKDFEGVELDLTVEKLLAKGGKAIRMFRRKMEGPV